MGNQDAPEPAQNGAGGFVNGLMALVQDRLTQIGALITALMASNTSLSSCGDNNIQRYKALDVSQDGQDTMAVPRDTICLSSGAQRGPAQANAT